MAGYLPCLLGDSGGPLACQRCNSCDWYLAGVSSYGEGCAAPGSYNVFTNVANYEEWITSITSQPLVQETCVRPSKIPSFFFLRLAFLNLYEVKLKKKNFERFILTPDDPTHG